MRLRVGFSWLEVPYLGLAVCLQHPMVIESGVDHNDC